MLPSAPRVALLLVKVNGQLTPPCDTSPLALQLTVDPASVPEPAPVPVMWLARVAVNGAVALVDVVGLTVYFRLPQPVGGVLADTDCHVPANDSIAPGGVGEVGASVLSFLVRRSQPAAASVQAARSAAAKVDFMIL